MNDEIVEEVHQIRARLYEETKNLTAEERRAKTHEASVWVQARIAECRARRPAEMATEKHLAPVNGYKS